MNLIPRDFFLDDVFNDFLTSKDTNRLGCDIYEKEDKYYIEMDTPGFTKENVNIDVDNGYLTVKVSKNEEKNDEGKNYIRKERNTKEVQRSFYVGDIDIDEVKASFKDGSLKIEIPKEKHLDTKKTIEIE